MKLRSLLRTAKRRPVAVALWATCECDAPAPSPYIYPRFAPRSGYNCAECLLSPTRSIRLVAVALWATRRGRANRLATHRPALRTAKRLQLLCGPAREVPDTPVLLCFKMHDGFWAPRASLDGL